MAGPKKIIITGPESTGKSTLAIALGNYYQCGYVAEYSREYLNKCNGKYTQADLMAITNGQIEWVKASLAQAPSILICDTGIEVIRIWSEWKYKECDEYIISKAIEQKPDLYLLLKPDIPWVTDALRENPHDREALYVYYQKSLRQYHCKVVEITGHAHNRLAQAIHAIDAL